MCGECVRILLPPSTLSPYDDAFNTFSRTSRCWACVSCFCLFMVVAPSNGIHPNPQQTTPHLTNPHLCPRTLSANPKKSSNHQQHQITPHIWSVCVKECGLWACTTDSRPHAQLSFCSSYNGYLKSSSTEFAFASFCLFFSYTKYNLPPCNAMQGIVSPLCINDSEFQREP